MMSLNVELGRDTQLASSGETRTLLWECIFENLLFQLLFLPFTTWTFTVWYAGPLLDWHFWHHGDALFAPSSRRTCWPAASSSQPLLWFPQLQGAASPKVSPSGHLTSGERAKQGYKCLAPGILIFLAETWASCVLVQFPLLPQSASSCFFHRYWS